MAGAVARQEVELERISFQGTLDTLRQYSDVMGRARNRAPANAAPSRIPCATNPDAASKKSRIAAATGLLVAESATPRAPRHPDVAEITVPSQFLGSSIVLSQAL